MIRAPSERPRKSAAAAGPIRPGISISFVVPRPEALTVDILVGFFRTVTRVVSTISRTIPAVPDRIVRIAITCVFSTFVGPVLVPLVEGHIAVSVFPPSTWIAIGIRCAALGIPIRIRIPLITRDGAFTIATVVATVVVSTTPPAIVAVNHTRVAIARCHAFGFTAAGRARLLSWRTAVVPHPALAGRRQVAGRNTLSADTIATSPLRSEWTCHDADQ